GCLQDGVGLVASRFTLIAYTTTLPAASAVRTGLDIFPCRFSKRFEQASPNFVMSAASLPEVRHRSPAQPVLEAVPNKTENSRRTKPSSRALRSEAEHRSGLRAGFQRACPLARFLGSFFGVRQRMNINNKPRARVRRTQCERKGTKLFSIKTPPPKNLNKQKRESISSPFFRKQIIIIPTVCVRLEASQNPNGFPPIGTRSNAVSHSIPL
ncbi:MAG: hypothetical protein J6R04_07810, partial [Clostridia bacterium]|nr:hypothetical protein [Clostridia bacterium]